MQKKKNNNWTTLSQEKLKIELGCGDNKKEGYFGVDIVDLPNVDLVMDIEKGLTELKSNSVDEFYSRHLMEHIVNFKLLQKEIHRTLKDGGVQIMTVPHFSNKYYYYPTHVRFFGLYSMSYFEKRSYFKRTLPNFYYDFNFDLVSVHLGFRNSRFGIKNIMGKYVYEKVFNLSTKMQEIYEMFFTNLISCTELTFVVKKNETS